MGFLWWILTGAIAGWLAGQLLKGKGFGILGNIIVGIVGGVIGGVVLGLVGFQSTTWIADVLSAVAGAVILMFIVGLVKGNK